MAAHDTKLPDRLTGLLAATAIGVYLLVIVGVTTSLTGPGASVTDPATLLTLGHWTTAVLVGLLVVATVVISWRGDADRRVIAAIVLAALLYPIQSGVGALTAATTVTSTVSALHLALGLTIFGLAIVALAWRLEALTGTDDDAPVTDLDELSQPDEPVPAAQRPQPAPDGPLDRLKITARAYVSMTKPRLMWLLCLVAFAGMALAAGPSLSPAVVALTLGGGVFSIGASGVFNHVLERDIDRRMERTADRPLALDVVPVRNAIAFGLVLAAISLFLFAQVNLLVAALGLIAILFYSVIYTLVLKPNTVQNTVIGGAAGALPALIGWAAVTGDIGVPGLVLAGVIFLWTPAHFYNLALAYRDDYERGGFPMMPVVRGETVTRKHILYYLGATLAGAIVLSAVSSLGLLYAVTSVALGTVFLWAVVRLHREQTESAAFRAFHASNAYLGLLLVAVVVDAALIGTVVG